MSDGETVHNKPPLSDKWGELRAHPERVQLVSGEEVFVLYPDGTPSVLTQMLEDPTAVVWCRHGDGPAVEVVEIPEGCVCFPADVVQGLCPQHIVDADSFPVISLVDLFEDPKWANERKVTPRFRREELSEEAITGYLQDLHDRGVY